MPSPENNGAENVPAGMFGAWIQPISSAAWIKARI